MIAAPVRAIVDARDGGVCQRCGTHVGTSPFGRSRHHRKAKGMGGSKLFDTPQNIVTLCGSGTTGCHGWIESNRELAYEQGWLIRRNSNDDPLDKPIPSYRGLILLDADGCYRLVDSPPEVAHV